MTNDFGFAGTFGVLALNDYNLKASYANHAVKLNWELWISDGETEYAIERSIDGRSFSSIINGTIVANGTKVSTTNFDLNLPAGCSLFILPVKTNRQKREGEKSVKLYW